MKPQRTWRLSVRHAYRRVIFPIAEGLIEVSEDALETLPRDRLNLMTIHQSKGLEFPITIVDVGTALEDPRWIQKRTRFPTSPDTVHKLEDYFRPHSRISALGQISNTALTRDVHISSGENGLPNTFVPGRNLIFLTYAAALAYQRGISHIVGGMCETDFSG